MVRTWIARCLFAVVLAGSTPAAAQDVALPVANAGKPLDAIQVLTRIAFGSCNHQDDDQGHWDAIAATQPQLFLALGDNVYGDHGYDGGPDLATFRDAYAKQAGLPDFRKFRAAIPMRATWDDHDFGPNDSGGNFARKADTEKLFESFWQSDPEISARPGVYDSLVAGPDGLSVQVIMLDTRFFRSPRDDGSDPEATVLGDAQWQWFNEQLQKPADLRVVVSSIQVLTQAHMYEKWANFPAERARLLAALGNRAGGGVVLLSGDRHVAGIYRSDVSDSYETIWEFTSSSLNRPAGQGYVSHLEADPRRDTGFYAGRNFGLVDLDWANRLATLRLLTHEGRELFSRTIGF